MRVVWGVLLLFLLGGCALESPKNSDSHALNSSLGKDSRNPHAKPKSPKSTPHTTLKSSTDSKRAPAVGHSSTAIKSHSGDKQGLSPTLKASSGWGIVKGEGATSRAVAKPQTHTCTFKPLPLNKKEDTESKEVKAGDSEKLESAIDSQSKNQAEDSNNQNSPPTNDINTPLANTTESDEEVQEDGQTYRAHISYKKGSKIKHGREILYYLNGTIAKQSFYLNGRLEGRVEIFSQRGVLIYEAHYRAGQLHGLCKIYDVASGRLKSEMNFKNGLQEGQMSVYDSSGKLWHRLEYKQGKRDGIATEYDDSGKILRQIRYIDDKEVK